LERAAVARAPGKVLLRVSGLSGGYEGSRVLNDFGIEVREREVVALLGRNGVGKTTALCAIMGACEIETGTIDFDGQSLVGLPSHVVSRHGIALVPQGRRLFGNLTVAENLRVAMRPGGACVQPTVTGRSALVPPTTHGGPRSTAASARSGSPPRDDPEPLNPLDEPFEGLAPAIVDDIMTAILELRSVPA
jgi:ABC-type branched-subunit amino acid transport system ATPase component